MIHQTNLNDEDNHPQVTIVNTKQHLNMNVSSTWQGKGTTNLRPKTLLYSFEKPKVTTKQGKMAVIFKEEDFMTNWATDCRWRSSGKSFIIQTQLSGGVKIAHYNSRHVYIDLDNELDYITVWTKQKMTIEGQLMRIQTWTPTFKPEEETPFVPVWVSLPGLPWHCYAERNHNCPLVSYWEGSLPRQCIDSKTKLMRREDLTRGKWQAIEYDNIPDYCNYCKHQGHIIQACTIKQRDEDYQKRKEMEANKKNKPKGEQEKQDNTSPTRKRKAMTYKLMKMLKLARERKIMSRDDPMAVEEKESITMGTKAIPKEWRPRYAGTTYYGQRWRGHDEQREEQEDRSKITNHVRIHASTNHPDTKHIEKDQDAVGRESRGPGIDLSLPTPLDPVFYIWSILCMLMKSRRDGRRDLRRNQLTAGWGNQREGIDSPATLSGEEPGYKIGIARGSTYLMQARKINLRELVLEAVAGGTTGKHILGIPQEKEGIIVETPGTLRFGEPHDKPRQ
ncbi:hypothetical protein H5410_027562 [Solanum commersonii]|uniref:DUF4283 domain-containing protein n=1 Tax=Solanum commersonii TaxID=4109 RepID=A0A9J5Z4T9_SOLCO|nr:hypothetical protein H5410_027562 [Solanum commersonii]